MIPPTRRLFACFATFGKGFASISYKWRRKKTFFFIWKPPTARFYCSLESHFAFIPFGYCLIFKANMIIFGSEADDSNNLHTLIASKFNQVRALLSFANVKKIPLKEICSLPSEGKARRTRSFLILYDTSLTSKSFSKGSRVSASLNFELFGTKCINNSRVCSWNGWKAFRDLMRL